MLLGLSKSLEAKPYLEALFCEVVPLPISGNMRSAYSRAVTSACLRTAVDDYSGIHGFEMHREQPAKLPRGDSAGLAGTRLWG